MNIIDEIIMESEYNVLMKLAEYYDKQYQMEFYAEAYFMEANGDNSNEPSMTYGKYMSTKIKNGINTGINAGKNAATNAVNTGKNAATNAVNATVKGVNTGVNATKNFIGKVISWCKKAVTVVSSNANKIPPNKPVKVPQGVTKLKENIANLSQNIMPHVKKVNEQAASGQQVDPNAVQQLIARIDELEKQVKALQIKVAAQNITPQPQQQAPTPQPAPQPVQQPQTQQQPQQAPQPAPQPAPTPTPAPQQQPTASDNQTTQRSSDGTVTVQGNEVREMVKQSADTLSNLEQFMNGFFNAHQNANAAIEELDKKAAQATATILNEVVATSKAAAAQCMPHDSGTTMTGAQLFDLINNNLAQNGHRRIWNVKTQLLEFSTKGPFISDSAGNVYPYATEPYQVRVNTLNPQLFDVVGKGGLDDSTLIIPAKFNDHGDLISRGVIRQGAIG